MDRYGIHFVHAGDEWYLLAEEEIPGEERYDGYIQLENGVGMMRLLENEFREALEQTPADDTIRRSVTLATGRLAAPLLTKLSGLAIQKFPGVSAQVVSIRNDFFGERITVSGLLTGRDIVAQLTGRELGDALLLPCNLLRSGEQTLLDDMTVDDLKRTLQVGIDIVKSSGQDLLYAILGIKEN